MRSWPVIGEPHVSDINTNTHHRIEKETNFCPPSCPDDQFAGDDGVQTRKTNQGHGPEVGVLSACKQLVIRVENQHWNVKDYDRMNQPYKVLK